MSVDAKSIILYHRSYRKIAASPRPFVLQFFFIALPLSLIVVFFYPDITRTVCLIAKEVLSPFFSEGSLRIVSYPYLTGNAHYLTLPGKFPSVVFSLLNAIAGLLILLLLPKIVRFKPLVILGSVVSFIMFLSAVFFLFLPDQFPYQASDYSDLYIKQQISIWFFVPVIMGLAVLPLPASLPSKVVAMLTSFIYSLIFGTVRYAVFLFIIGKISLLYMAVLFFALGPLVDFVYIVGIYCVYAARLAKNIKGNYTLWKWSY
ncbi:MAG TPA: hypothetical protein VK448_01530 [Dissulfurispiraceae bacterium]|nr:hypothetical protein [Dissulfurispiraceae bacterium]